MHTMGANWNLVGGGWEGGDLDVVDGCAQIFFFLVGALILHFLFFPTALLLKNNSSEFTKLIIQSLDLFHACVFMLKI